MALLEDVKKALENLTYGKIVACPKVPIPIPGIAFADAFDANDCLGTLIELDVPKSGIIQSATLLDLDDEGTQIDLEIFQGKVTQIASDAAWAPSDEDMLLFVTELVFFSFDDHINNQSSEIVNVGKGYTAPAGKLWIQAVTRSTPTIAAGSSPRIQIQIQSLDPDFQG